MKTLILAVCVLCASVAWGQATAGGNVLSAEPQITNFTSHQQRARQSGMAIEQRVMERSASISAHGVLPLWEFAPVAENVPLGDVARNLRQEHEQVRKAEHVFTN